MAKIAVIGSLNMDLVAVAPRLPLAGETLTGTRYLNVPGGKGANQAYAAARLGGDVAMLGCVGADDYGTQMLANLAEAGCDISGVGRVGGASGVAVIVVAESGANQIVVVPGANHAYLPADVLRDRPRVAGARFALLQLEIPLETVIEAARVVRSAGAQVILDPAPAPSSLPRELLQNVDVLTPNETEAALLAGEQPRGGSLQGALSVDDARAIAARLQSMGAKAVIVKMGAQGCLLSDGEAATLVPAPQVSAVDTTAAGDVFNAAFAVACSEGASRLDACRFAVRAAALSVTRLGAQSSMPTRAELNAFGER
jgi:ribokinase